jgi:hypothetical protein
MSVVTSPVCVMCRRGQPRLRVQILKTGRTADLCSVKCLLSWCLGFSLDGVQGAVQKLLKGLPK